MNTAEKADGEFLLFLSPVMWRDIKSEYFMPVAENIFPGLVYVERGASATRNLSRQELRNMQNGMALL